MAVAGSINCSMVDCIKTNTSNAEQIDMAKHKLGQFGFYDIFNVVAYSAMGVGK